MNFANKISTFRLLSVPFFIGCLVYYSDQHKELLNWALGIFFLAVLSDAVDGFVARKTKQISQAGRILDPLADKLLLMNAVIFLSLDKFRIHLPFWFVLLVISRDMIIILGTLVIYMVKQRVDIIPTLWGKLTTFAQVFCVIAVLLQWEISFFFWWVAAFFTIVSGIDYMRRGLQILYAP